MSQENEQQEQEQQQEHKDEFVEIKDEFIPIKGTSIDKMPLAKKIIEEKANQIEARKRFERNPPKFKSEADYYRDKVQSRNRLSDGTIIMGALTEAEKHALRTNNEILIQKYMMLRERSRRIARAKMLEGKTQRDYFSGLH